MAHRFPESEWYRPRRDDDEAFERRGEWQGGEPREGRRYRGERYGYYGGYYGYDPGVRPGERGEWSRERGPEWGRGRETERGRGGDWRRERDEERGFFERAGDEVRSWFGDEEAARRREREERESGWYGGERRRDPGYREERGAFGPDERAWARQWGYVEGLHTGKGPRGYQRSDERIREDLCDWLARHGDIDATDVDVEVQNREVTLEGVVASRREKRLAEDLAEGVFGVTEVHNRLRVRREGMGPMAQREGEQPGREQPSGPGGRRRAA